MTWEEIWFEWRTTLLTFLAIAFIVFLIFGFLSQRDKQMGRLKLDEIIKYLLRKTV
jgi:hypothetical protein